MPIEIRELVIRLNVAELAAPQTLTPALLAELRAVLQAEIEEAVFNRLEQLGER